MRPQLKAQLGWVVLATAFPITALAQREPGPWNWPGPWHAWGGGWGFWWIFPLIMLFMIVACAGFFVFARKSGGHWSDPAFHALSILNERYAKGEIRKEEYEEKKSAILAGGPR
jgi:putative membrane protein